MEVWLDRALKASIVVLLLTLAWSVVRITNGLLLNDVPALAIGRL